ncbi:DEAD/DEAH box helicase [Algoriphagus alkaliphilus]|nr:AAA domain-containing protein [Algoriphagus alkaliphilus]
MKFSLDKDHFLFQLGEHFQKEGKVEKKENEEKENLSVKEKIKEGYLIESAKVVEIKDDEVLVDISGSECNLSDGSALNIFNRATGSEGAGSVLSTDGQYLSIEPRGWWPKVGDEVNLEKNFIAFDFLISKKEDDYYRILRSEKNAKLVDQKLTNNCESIQLSIPKVSVMGNLDKSQIKAFNKTLGSNSVTLIQGPPGTGKTTFAAQLSKYLLEQGHEVLVTAFTHDAINNILKKIQELGVPVSKIGKKSKCSEPLRASRKDMFSTYGKAKSVIGMTIQEFLKNHKKFDFIIVDEASQMDIVSGVHFLASSTKTIFIGDNMQLPNIPKIANTEFSISIFDLLLRVYKSSPLLTSYRFNQSICDYISPNYYNGKLTCGELVQSEQLVFPNNLKSSSLKILNSQFLENPLLFIHTEEEVEFLLNKGQANLIADLVEDFLTIGILKKEIGVIAPNNMQVNFIKKVLSARKMDWKGIQIETVNKFQGQEKEVILYSSVITKIGSEKAKYDFFFDIRRFNVAVSRAKKMAVVLGNRDLVAQAGSLLPSGEKIADFLNRSAQLDFIANSSTIENISTPLPIL